MANHKRAGLCLSLWTTKCPIGQLLLWRATKHQFLYLLHHCLCYHSCFKFSITIPHVYCRTVGAQFILVRLSAGEERTVIVFVYADDSLTRSCKRKHLKRVKSNQAATTIANAELDRILTRRTVKSGCDCLTTILTRRESVKFTSARLSLAILHQQPWVVYTYSRTTYPTHRTAIIPTRDKRAQLFDGSSTGMEAIENKSKP